MMNKVLKAKLREGGKRLRNMHVKGASTTELQSAKHAAKQSVWSSVHRGLFG